MSRGEYESQLGWGESGEVISVTFRIIPQEAHLLAQEVSERVHAGIEGEVEEFLVGMDMIDGIEAVGLSVAGSSNLMVHALSDLSGLRTEVDSPRVKIVRLYQDTIEASPYRSFFTGLWFVNTRFGLENALRSFPREIRDPFSEDAHTKGVLFPSWVAIPRRNSPVLRDL